MRKQLHSVLNYFGYFSYAPSIDEIHTFFPQKISKKSLQVFINGEVASRKLVKTAYETADKSFGLLERPIYNTVHSSKIPFYTLPQYSIITRKFSRLNNHKKDYKHVRTIQIFISILKRIPFVRFVGITGKSSMRGYQTDDDLDLCIVTKMNTLWITRFCAVILAKILGIHGGKGVCLNLFFDESDLVIPKRKQNSYIAHELIQMKPIIDKEKTFGRFLSENWWICRYFPNVIVYKYKLPQRHAIPGRAFIDSLFKYIQLPRIYRNHTAFYISQTQLWLFKKDFEKKLKRVGLVI